MKVGMRLLDLHRQLEERNRLLEHFALTDPLTGLPNRRAIDPGPSRTARPMRHGFSFWVVLIDLDHFKRVNDAYGHEAGDAVLKAFGEILKSIHVASDISGRIGGEEFLHVITHADEAICRQSSSVRAPSWRRRLLVRRIGRDGHRQFRRRRCPVAAPRPPSASWSAARTAPCTGQAAGTQPGRVRAAIAGRREGAS